MNLLKYVDALTVKSGPTQSGETNPPPSPSPGPEYAVGGQVLPVIGGEIISLIIVALVLVFGFVLMRKTGLLSRLVTRLGL